MQGEMRGRAMHFGRRASRPSLIVNMKLCFMSLILGVIFTPSRMYSNYGISVSAFSPSLGQAARQPRPTRKARAWPKLTQTTSFSVPTARLEPLLAQRKPPLDNNDNDDQRLAIAKKSKTEQEEEESIRLRILESRRYQIRMTLKAAESMRYFRMKNGMIPELDENGKPIKSDGKAAVTLTAFMVAAGAVALRVGGRAALISAIGLDMVTENPEVKENLNSIIDYANSLDLTTEVLLFVGAWTAVKVFCFDAGGVALALSAGILFGGVIPGALLSATAATFGSSVAFGLAKLDTPVRRKALELLDEYPSLRGIEKVVAQDGLKAILTLRLAPVLPIPIGMYNYIYGVTNVAYGDFAIGIFLGSIKPYLLDSYLGFFGKSLVDGSADSADGIQDIILLVALGVSVLIGVFASQLAGETWDSVLAELEAEKKAKAELDGDGEAEVDDGVVREVMGWKLPMWVVGFQLSMQQANQRVNDLIHTELDAKVWNYTIEEPPPRSLDPAYAMDSPEVMGANQGMDYLADICTGFALSPNLMTAFAKYSDPLFDEATDVQERSESRKASSSTVGSPSNKNAKETMQQEVLLKLADLRTRTTRRIEELEDQLSDKP